MFIKRAFNLPVVFFIALLAGCSTTLQTAPPAGVSADTAVPFRGGETWAYTVRDAYTELPRGHIEYRVTAASANGIDVLRTNKPYRQSEFTEQERYTPDGNWLERPMTNLQMFRFSPAYNALPFPLTAGKTWRSYTNATDPATGQVNRVRIDGTVLGWEKVTVPAGTFDAIKVRRIVYAGNQTAFRYEEQIKEYDWYAPAIGRVVRQETSSEWREKMSGCDHHPECNLHREDWLIAELTAHAGGR